MRKASTQIDAELYNQLVEGAMSEARFSLPQKLDDIVELMRREVQLDPQHKDILDEVYRSAVRKSNQGNR